MRVPISWLRDYVPIEMPLDELATRLSISTAEIEGIERRGVPDENGNLGLFRVGKVLEAEKHPNADRLQLCRVDVGEGEPRQIVCGAWNFGAGATVAVALPGATLPGGLQLEQRKVRGELSDGMILAEDEIDLGTDHSGIMLLPETEPGTPLGDVLPLRRRGAARRVDRQPARPALDLRDRARGRRPLRPRACAAARHRSRAGGRRAGRRHGRGSRRLPALHRAPLPQRPGRTVAGLGEGAAARGGDAADLERRRRDELRDARAREPSARFRPEDARGREDHRPARPPGRDDQDSRRRRPQARGERPRDRRCRAGGRDRRDHGRRGDRDRRVDDRRAPRGRELRADRDLSHVGAAPASHRRLEPLGEGRRPVPGRPGRRSSRRS